MRLPAVSNRKSQAKAKFGVRLNSERSNNLEELSLEPGQLHKNDPNWERPAWIGDLRTWVGSSETALLIRHSY